MFFKVATNHTEITFPFSVSYQLGNFYVQCDRGWHQLNDCLYKGYCLDKSLENKIANNDFSESRGNYVILHITETACQLYHDDSRSFPLFYNKSTITNYYDKNLKQVWFPSTVHYNEGFNYFLKDENKILFDCKKKMLTKTEIVDYCCNYLIECVENLNTDLPFYCADSQGVDSTVVRSVLDYCGIEYKTVNASSASKANLGWGYKQLYITSEAHMQITGFCGDEILLRNPQYCQWLLDPYNIDLIEEFDKVSQSYMKGFFNAKYRPKLSHRTELFPKRQHSFKQTANVCMNDFQMWHTDNTLTFTPFRNRSLAEQLLYADVDAILDQVIHASISKEIIKRMNPKLLNNLSKHKNNYT